MRTYDKYACAKLESMGDPIARCECVCALNVMQDVM